MSKPGLISDLKGCSLRKKHGRRVRNTVCAVEIQCKTFISEYAPNTARLLCFNDNALRFNYLSFKYFFLPFV